MCRIARENAQLTERCKKLASRVPEWPKGYRPAADLVTIILVHATKRELIMIVDLIDSMGSDLTVVNAARVSFSKSLNGWH